MVGETCGVTVRRGDTWSSRSEPCGKPAKGASATGAPMCGLHLNADRKRHELAEERATVQAITDRLHDGGFPAHVGWDGYERNKSWCWS